MGEHIDRQLTLTPRQYATDPHRFGRDPKLTFHIPPGGTETGMKSAAMQHHLVIRWRTMGWPSGAELGRRLNFSRSVWSRTINGYRFAGQVVTNALLMATRPPGPGERRGPQQGR